MPNYQAILAYFRHKKLMTERRKQYERMRRAVAVLGDQDAVNELAQGKANVGDDLVNGTVPLLRRGRKGKTGAIVLAAFTEKDSDSGPNPHNRQSRRLHTANNVEPALAKAGLRRLVRKHTARINNAASDPQSPGSSSKDTPTLTHNGRIHVRGSAQHE